jgi:flagellar protein FlaI
MANVVLPFTKDFKTELNLEDNFASVIFQQLSPEFQCVVQEHPHLLEYLHMIPIDKVGIPQYYAKLSRNLGGEKRPNIIYPTKRGGVFIHILFNEEGDRNHYITVEPNLTVDVGKLLERVDEKLLQLRTRLKIIDDHKDREEQFNEYIDLVACLSNEPDASLIDRFRGMFQKEGPSPAKIPMTEREMKAVRYMFLREKLARPPDERPVYRRHQLLGARPDIY